MKKEDKYYVYIYLDPRKPGQFQYSGLNMCFLYEPFYIGKGSDKQMYSHLKETEETNDDVLEEEILKAEDETESQKEEPTEINLQKSEEEIEKILNGESFEEELNQYLERAKKFDLLTSHEIRSIKKRT